MIEGASSDRSTEAFGVILSTPLAVRCQNQLDSLKTMTNLFEPMNGVAMND